MVKCSDLLLLILLLIKVRELLLLLLELIKVRHLSDDFSKHLRHLRKRVLQPACFDPLIVELAEFPILGFLVLIHCFELQSIVLFRRESLPLLLSNQLSVGLTQLRKFFAKVGVLFMLEDF